MSGSLKRLAFLSLSAPVLTEIGTGNTTLAAFFRPPVPLLLVLTYGFPLVVIAELRSRWRLSAAGVFLLGLAYGFLNEGLLAQTLIRRAHMPIGKFDDYIYVAGFNLSWIAVIVPWHAFFAVIFPLSLADRWFPLPPGKRMLGANVFVALALLLAAIIAFLGVVRVPHPQMLAFLGMIGALTAVAALFCRRGTGSVPGAGSDGMAAVIGFAAYPAAIIPCIVLASFRAAPLLYFAWTALAGLLLLLVGRRFAGRVPFLACGAYASLGFFHAAFGFAGRSWIEVATGGTFALFFVAMGLGGPWLLKRNADELTP